MKKKIIILSSVILGLILVIFLSILLINKQNEKEISIIWKDEAIKVYENKELKDYLVSSNAIIKNKKINTSEVGKYEEEYEYTYKGKKYKNIFSYQVIDDVAPKIFGSGSKTVNVNYNGNLCDLIMIADNYDRDLECVIEGDYDLTKVGSYKIKFVVTDDSLNTANHNLVLKVVNPSSGGGSSNSPKTNLTITEAKEKYLNNNLELGIDVSKWQGDVDYNLVKAEGINFVMLRMGIRSGIGKEINMDTYYLKNIKKAKDAGLKVGVYFYSKASNILEAIEEAEWIINNLNGEKLDLPIVFDWENWSSWNSFHLNFYDLNALAQNFIKVVEEAGYKGMLYSSKFYLENFWFDKEYSQIWLAHYTNATSYENYDMWQFSNIGSVKGINGDVDFDVLKIKD